MEKFFEVPLYCKRLRNSSPLKSQSLKEQESASQQLIPGLPEKERLLNSKKRKKKKKQARTELSQAQPKGTAEPDAPHGKEYFFKTIRFSEMDSEQCGNFEFSDYSGHDGDSSSTEEDEFADSKEVLSDSDTVVKTSTPLTAMKRPLTSPAENLKKKKVRTPAVKK